MKHILIIAFSVLVGSTSLVSNSFGGTLSGEREFDVKSKGRNLSAEKIEQQKEEQKSEATEKQEKVEKRRPPYHEGALNDR